MHRIFLLKGAEVIPIQNIISTYDWGGSITQLGRTMNFTINTHNVALFPENRAELWDKILLTDESGIPIFQGVIINKRRTGRHKMYYNVVDVGWYLGKTEKIYQFNKMPFNAATQKILNAEGIQVEALPSINLIIDYLYFGSTPDSIIQSFMDQYHEVNTKLLRWRINPSGKFFMFERGSVVKEINFSIAKNTGVHNINQVLSDDTTIEESADGFYNSVKVAYQEKGQVYTQAVKSNINPSIGEIQKVISIPKEDVAKANKIAETALVNLMKIGKTVVGATLGDNNILAGDSVYLDIPELELNGLYEIVNDNHLVSNGVHHLMLFMEEVI